MALGCKSLAGHSKWMGPFPATPLCPVCPDLGAHHRLQRGPRHHGIGQLHLLGQHGHVLLLDQVVPAVDLQLRFQVRGWVQVLAVLPRAAALQDKDSSLDTLHGQHRAAAACCRHSSTRATGGGRRRQQPHRGSGTGTSEKSPLRTDSGRKASRPALGSGERPWHWPSTT